jgi:glycosyltransferase involved in cell wall biosynthesis
MVTPHYPPKLGGVEVHVREVSERLGQMGNAVTVVTTTPDARAAEGSAVEVLGVPARLRRGDLLYAPRIAAVMRSRPWDVVHVQSYHTLVPPLAMRAARRAGIPYVLTFHGGGHSSRVRRLIRGPQLLAIGRGLRGAARLVALAEFEIEHYGRLLRIPPERFELIPNGADLPAVPDATSVAGDVLEIASIGRLERYKGHQRALEAFAELLPARPDARLWIAGSGPYKRALERLATRLGVSQRVEISSVAPGERARFAERLSRVGLVLLLSDFETHPVALLEAASLGRPSVVSDTSGLRELALKGYARTVPARASPRYVAAVLAEELERPSSPRPSLETFTWDSCARALGALYEEAVREARPSAS